MGCGPSNADTAHQSRKVKNNNHNNDNLDVICNSVEIFWSTAQAIGSFCVNIRVDLLFLTIYVIHDTGGQFDTALKADAISLFELVKDIIIIIIGR